MPQNACPIVGTVFHAGTLTVLARLVGHDAVAVNQATIRAIACSIFSIDPDDADQAVADHQAVALDKTAVLFDGLQTDALWTVDATGYNFLHTIDITKPAFTVRGRTYRIVYTLTPSTGQPIVFTAEPTCI
jgi:hypothetical protein